MATNSITITSTDKLDFDAYVARPKSGSGPVVVVIQEIFGVNQWLREVADFVAEQGFIAVAPDLFHRQEKGIQLTDKTEAEWKRAFELYQGFDEHKGVADLGATVNAARKMEGSNGKVGCMGFCLGGKLAYLMAVHSDADANVGYYGVGIEKSLNDAQEVIKKALEVNDCVTIHSYPGKDHAFCRVGGEHYDKAACDTAHKRTVEFFKTHLG
jgi:carboxymethylenebutenolidase